MAFLRRLNATLLVASAVAATAVQDELPRALATDSCETSEALELRQLRGVEASVLERDMKTCGDWLKIKECDKLSEKAKEFDVECEDGCSQDTCCEERASCSFFTMGAGCAGLELPDNVTNMVWGEREATEDEDGDFELFCDGAEQNLESCGKSCCQLKPCTKCTGKQYTTGCMAGSAGMCEDCPTESSCPVGEFQSCGEGVMGKCTKCKNGPDNSLYTETSMASECLWECSKDYQKKNGTCVAAKCSAWTGKCDLTSQIANEGSTTCEGECSETSCCACAKDYQKKSGTCVAAKCRAWAGKCDLTSQIVNEGSTTCEGECSETSCCTPCPTKSACSAGEYQTCSEGVLSKCQKCSNAPSGASYSSGALSAECSWECDDGYKKAMSKDGEASCKATCGVFHCSSEKLALIPKANETLGDSEDECCMDAGCAKLATKSALSEASLEAGGCQVVKSEADCGAKYVVSGNTHGKGTGATIYTPCIWDSSQKICNWGYHQFRNCIL